MYPVWYLTLMRPFWKKRAYSVRPFSYKGEEFAISLAGVYQKENAVLALNALEELDRLGWTTTMEQRKDGLLHTSWKGRFTVINKRPLFIVDGAHKCRSSRQDGRIYPTLF